MRCRMNITSKMSVYTVLKCPSYSPDLLISMNEYSLMLFSKFSYLGLVFMSQNPLYLDILVENVSNSFFYVSIWTWVGFEAKW